ncbi:MAG: AMP-binding protein [Bacteroidetes bacterium]|nr:AMP-binding protein [Bacteroidota bacterium]
MESILTIPEFLTEQVQRFPAKKVAMYKNAEVGVWSDLNWTAYYEKIKSAAELLLALNIKTEDRVVIILPTSIQWDLFEKACLLIGATIVGIETHARPDSMNEIIKQVSPQLVIIEDKKTAVTLQEQFNISKDVFYNIDQNTWVDLPVTQRTVWPIVSADTVATIIFTSGSTGKQKGIAYTHRQLIQAAQTLSIAFAQENGRTICWLPLASLFQRMVNLCALITNASIYFVTNPKDIINVLPTIQPTVLIGVPLLYEKVYASVKQKMNSQPFSIRLLLNRLLRIKKSNVFYKPVYTLLLKKIAAIFGGKMQYMLTGSAPCRLEVLTFFESIGIPLIEAYGMSENVLPIALNRPKEYKLGSVGKPLLPNQVKIAADGEIFIKGPGLFNGYIDKDTKTHFSDDGFFPTGDLGYFDKQGFLFLTGRKNDLIKMSTGRKISIGAIGEQLMASPFLNQVVLVGANRPCLACLVTINKESSKDKNIRTIVDDTVHSIQKTNLNRSSYEKIRGGIILENSFSIEKAELTAGLKIRRKAIEENYQSEIEELYKKIELSRGSFDYFFEELKNKKGYYFLCH